MSTLAKDEIAATGVFHPKTTSLFFDKLWVPEPLVAGKVTGSRAYKLAPYTVPAELCLDEPSAATETYVGAAARQSTLTTEYVRDASGNIAYANPRFRSRPIPPEILDAVLAEFMHSDTPAELDELEHAPTTIHRNQAIRRVVGAFERNGIAVTPVFLELRGYDRVFPNQEHEGLAACLAHVPTVLESKLTWKQVLEFRADAESVRKLRRFRNWFTLELLNKSGTEIQAQLSQKLDDYCWALRKHGLEAIVGGATSLLAFAATPAVVDTVVQHPLGGAVAGLAIGGGAVAWVLNKRIQRLELQRNEAAYIYDVIKLAE